MAVFTIISAWICSLFLAAGLAWMAARRSLVLAEVPAQAVLCPTPTLVLAQPFSPLCGYPAVSVRNTPGPIAASTRRRGIFDDMPSVETVRAQAKAIREAEDIWGSPKTEISELHEQLAAAHGRSANTKCAEGPTIMWVASHLEPSIFKNLGSPETINPTKTHQSSSSSTLV